MYYETKELQLSSLEKSQTKVNANSQKSQTQHSEIMTLRRSASGQEMNEPRPELQTILSGGFNFSGHFPASDSGGASELDFVSVVVSINTAISS